MVPEIGIASFGRVVVQDQEITDAQELVIDDAVELVAFDGAVPALRYQFDQVGHGRLDQVNGR